MLKETLLANQSVTTSCQAVVNQLSSIVRNGRDEAIAAQKAMVSDAKSIQATDAWMMAIPQQLLKVFSSCPVNSIKIVGSWSIARND